MSLLYRIVYAAHANGTHHKLALDALNRLQAPDADRWRNLFLKHADAYLEGSKAPDKQFKDFVNHVLHVQDDYWGGAPEKADAWYAKLVAALRTESWREAAFAAGVLSHYYTDPIQPFHTAQSEAESAIHRACEWSISRSYDDLAKIGRAKFANIEVEIPDGAAWLKEMVCRGAETSNRSYEKLIVHYDIHRGAADPPTGLDDTSRFLLAELLTYASTGLAHILDRAFAESGAAPPSVSLTVETFLATLKIPSKWVEKRLTNAEDRAVVRAMYAELQATGHVEATLPEDDRVVRDLYELQVAGPRADKLAAARARRIGTSDEPEAKPASASKPQSAPKQQAAPESQPAGAEPLRVYLTATDNLEAAPSIGPKTAKRFAKIGVVTVGDFLAADAAQMAGAIGTRGMTWETLRLWQHQARLVMDVPGLRGTHAQLLTGAGYLDAAAVAEANDADLAANVLRFAASSEGQRILRKGEPPSEEKIKGWIGNAAARMAA
jgi:predicted flap endonuclease-1-like 5' DNA nuclease